MFIPGKKASDIVPQPILPSNELEMLRNMTRESGWLNTMEKIGLIDELQFFADLMRAEVVPVTEEQEINQEICQAADLII